MKQKELIGFILFSLGVLISMMSTAQLPAEGQVFSSTWPAYILGVICGIVGLVLWHQAKNQARKDLVASQDQKSVGSAIGFLHEALTHLTKLSGDLLTLENTEIIKRVNYIMDHFIFPLAQTRNQIIAKFGMVKGAEILIAVAYGERMLNRVWSAASDGHEQEARKVFCEAKNAFAQAVSLSK
jgi:hypothetical protein